MSIMSRFPSKYLKGEHIEDGETVTIVDVRDELVGLIQDELPVLYVREHPKGIVLNRTNAVTLEKLLGEDETAWGGKTVEIFTEMTRNPNTGEYKPAIRFRAAPKKKAAKVAAEVEGEESPY